MLSTEQLIKNFVPTVVSKLSDKSIGFITDECPNLYNNIDTIKQLEQQINQCNGLYQLIDLLKDNVCDDELQLSHEILHVMYL